MAGAAEVRGSTETTGDAVQLVASRQEGHRTLVLRFGGG